MRYYSLLITLTIIIFSCSDEKENEISNNVYNIQTLDVGNDFTAADLKVSFAVEDLSQVTGFRILIVKASSDILTVKLVTELEPSAYHKVILNGRLGYNVRLEPEQTDTDGDDLEEGQSYFIQVFSEGSEKLSQPSDNFILEENDNIPGAYVGLWNDNIYDDFGISTEIEKLSEGRYRGIFYYSSNFTPCCGGDDDGHILFTIENDSILNFVYNQDLPNFMGGCPGRYTGEGILVEDIDLNISFAGNDCEGAHTGGNIYLERTR